MVPYQAASTMRLEFIRSKMKGEGNINSTKAYGQGTTKIEDG